MKVIVSMDIIFNEKEFPYKSSKPSSPLGNTSETSVEVGTAHER